MSLNDKWVTFARSVIRRLRQSSFPLETRLVLPSNDFSGPQLYFLKLRIRIPDEMRGSACLVYGKQLRRLIWALAFLNLGRQLGQPRILRSGGLLPVTVASLLENCRRWFVRQKVGTIEVDDHGLVVFKARVLYGIAFLV